MGRLNSLIKFVVVNANVLLFLGGLGTVVLAVIALHADFLLLFEAYTKIRGVILILFGLVVTFMSIVGYWGTFRQTKRDGRWGGRRILSLYQLLLLAVVLAHGTFQIVICRVEVNLQEAAQDLPVEHGDFESHFRDGFNDAYFRQQCSSEDTNWFSSSVDLHCPERMSLEDCAACSTATSRDGETSACSDPSTYDPEGCCPNQELCEAGIGDACAYSACRRGMISLLLDYISPTRKYSAFVLAFEGAMLVLTCLLICYNPRDTAEDILVKTGTLLRNSRGVGFVATAGKQHSQRSGAELDDDPFPVARVKTLGQPCVQPLANTRTGTENSGDLTPLTSVNNYPPSQPLRQFMTPTHAAGGSPVGIVSPASSTDARYAFENTGFEGMGRTYAAAVAATQVESNAEAATDAAEVADIPERSSTAISCAANCGEGPSSKSEERRRGARKQESFFIDEKRPSVETASTGVRGENGPRHPSSNYAAEPSVIDEEEVVEQAPSKHLESSLVGNATMTCHDATGTADTASVARMDMNREASSEGSDAVASASHAASRSRPSFQAQTPISGSPARARLNAAITHHAAARRGSVSSAFGDELDSDMSSHAEAASQSGNTHVSGTRNGEVVSPTHPPSSANVTKSPAHEHPSGVGSSTVEETSPRPVGVMAQTPCGSPEFTLPGSAKTLTVEGFVAKPAEAANTLPSQEADEQADGASLDQLDTGALSPGQGHLTMGAATRCPQVASRPETELSRSSITAAASTGLADKGGGKATERFFVIAPPPTPLQTAEQTGAASSFGQALRTYFTSPQASPPHISPLALAPSETSAVDTLSGLSLNVDAQAAGESASKISAQQDVSHSKHQFSLTGGAAFASATPSHGEPEDSVPPAVACTRSSAGMDAVTQADVAQQLLEALSPESHVER